MGKQIKKTFIFLFLLFQFGYIGVFAQNEPKTAIISQGGTEKPLSREVIIRYIGDILLSDIPKSYQYIHLKFTDVKNNTKLYESLQKMVYSDIMENSPVPIDKTKTLSVYSLYSLVGKIYKVNLLADENISELKKRETLPSDLRFIQKLSQRIKEDQGTKEKISDMMDSISSPEELNKFQIYFDAYKTLLSEHYNSGKLKKTDMVYGSIIGLTQATEDQFTTFFPPSESKDFNESLSGEFEGIGAYVEMEQPGELKIISAITGTPAEKVGLKGGDIILKIDGNEITPTMTINDAVRLIKGKAGTTVKIFVKRGEETFEVEVVREKITVKDVEYKVIDDTFFYIQIRMFGDKVFDQFNQSLLALKEQTNIKKVIIDLRNNPGGYLDKVTDMLSLVVPKGKPTAVVKYKQGQLPYLSEGYEVVKLADYEVYILVNSGTASASEIMTGTMKDYFPNLQIVGEKTYGKGSVQTIRSYYDGSSLKYTIARWYTGKTQTGIDKIGISPDIEVKADIEKMKKGEDNQLDYILKKK